MRHGPLRRGQRRAPHNRARPSTEGDSGDDVGRTYEMRARNHVGIRFRAERIVRRRRWVEPITELAVTAPDQVGSSPRAFCIHPPSGTVELALEDAAISGALVEHPGTTVAASPHAAAGQEDTSLLKMSGTMCGTVPSGSCSAERSASHELRKPPTSYKKEAVGAKTWMSPVHPSRSSRCGQSVGTSRKLPRMPHTTFSCSWLRSASEEVNQPVRRSSLPRTTRAMSSALSSSIPVTSA